MSDFTDMMENYQTDLKLQEEAKKAASVKEQINNLWAQSTGGTGGVTSDPNPYNPCTSVGGGGGSTSSQLQGALGGVSSTGYYPYPHSNPCPSCGACPTCGRRDSYPRYYWGYGYPYYNNQITYTGGGDGTTYGTIGGGSGAGGHNSW